MVIVNLIQRFLILMIRGYRAIISPILAALTVPLGMGCRYTPTCSQYALEAIQRHGAVRGTWLAMKRLSRCHPWGSCGYDPVRPESVPDPLDLRHPNSNNDNTHCSAPVSLPAQVASFKTCEHGS